MIASVGKLERKAFKEEIIIVPLNVLKQGVNDYKEFIIKLVDHEVEYVIDKVCDHAGGRLVVKNGKAVCPMHNWTLDLDLLTYEGGNNKKKKLDFEEVDGAIRIKRFNYELVNNCIQKEKSGIVKFQWLNHASIYIECNGISIMLDPWLFGPSFLTGWWLAEPSTVNSLELLKNCDYIFISHNHPDHCHLETLSIVDRDKCIIVPKFTSNSVRNFCEKAGFTNVVTAEFLTLYKLGDSFNISILKSGDFRDDSGVYIEANGHEFLFSVDANFLNSWVLPRNLDLFASAYASGASGFPLCYHNYTEEEKAVIIGRTKNVVRGNLFKICGELQPKYFLPYAGMFKEYSERDNYIKLNNFKNQIDDYLVDFQKLSTKVIIPDKLKEFYFENGVLGWNLQESDFLKSENTELYINQYKEAYVWDELEIRRYFENCTYSENQVLYIIPTDDDFIPCNENVVYVNFSSSEVRIVQTDDIRMELDSYRVMIIHVRSEIFMAVVKNMLPWEDFLIGFQCRIYRYPNVYEDSFWFHFTNEYVSKENFRYSPLCGSCSVINQNPVWYKSKIK